YIRGMGYRDEREGLQQRVQELEGELDRARATIARLQGAGGQIEAAPEKVGWLTGAPERLDLAMRAPVPSLRVHRDLRRGGFGHAERLVPLGVAHDEVAVAQQRVLPVPPRDAEG